MIETRTDQVITEPVKQDVAVVVKPDIASIRLKLMALHAQAAALREEGSNGNDPQYQARVLAVACMIAEVPGAAEAICTLPRATTKLEKI